MLPLLRVRKANPFEFSTDPSPTHSLFLSLTHTRPLNPPAWDYSTGLGSPQEHRGLVCNSQQLLSPMEGAGWGSPQATPPNPSSVSRFAPLSLPPGGVCASNPFSKASPTQGFGNIPAIPWSRAGTPRTHWVETSWRRSPGSREIKFPLAPHRSQLMEDTTPSSRGWIQPGIPMREGCTSISLCKADPVTHKPAFSLL